MIMLGFDFAWNQKLGRPECPYMTRWLFKTPLLSIRLHHWFSGDDPRAYHDHPFWFLTFILWGGYTDISPDGNDVLSAGSIRFRRATHRHTVKVNPGGCWSLLITGPDWREWGFWVKGKFWRRNKYFYEHGHHPCE